jgi:hypothetical protein
MPTNKKGFTPTTSEDPWTPGPTQEPTTDNEQPTAQESELEPDESIAITPPSEPPNPAKQMWTGGSLVFTEDNRTAIQSAHAAMWQADEPMYLLHDDG